MASLFKGLTEEHISMGTDYSLTLKYSFINDFSSIQPIIEEYLEKICFGTSGMTPLETVKKHVKDRIIGKKSNEDLINGFVSEFIANVILMDLGFANQSLFFNLEDQSFKKGFDGLFIFDDDYWFMESKSGREDKKHNSKIQEACNDLLKKFNMDTNNNPWLNALCHFKNITSGRAYSKNENKLYYFLMDAKDFFINNKSIDPKDLNVIPVSTIFVDAEFDFDNLKTEIQKIDDLKKFKNAFIFCYNNNIKNEFLEYFGV